MKYLDLFTPIGKWVLDENYKSHKILQSHGLSGINFLIDKSKSTLKDVVYVFKTDKEIIYICETSSTLNNRFSSYRYGFDKIEDTDNRVKIELTNRLVNNENIDIYIWQPYTEFVIADETIKVPLSKPIEEFLILKIAPFHNLINKKGKKIEFLTESMINKVFCNVPSQWGFRGDSYLWEDIKIYFLNNYNSITKNDFEKMLRKCLNNLIEAKGIRKTNEKVLMYDYPKEGMSGGFISLNWWEENGIPTILNNYKKII